MSTKPSVVFVCVKNSGKSQLAAGLMRQIAGDSVDVCSGGTAPGESLNPLSVQVLLEVGVDITDEHPQPVTTGMITAADMVITLGRDATVDHIPGTRFDTWDTDEPSTRGIDGIVRMRLIRDDITSRVRHLSDDLP